MEKIIIITTNERVNRLLLQCLELIFPECDVELINGKAVNGPGSNTIDDIGGRSDSPYENFDC